MRLPGPERLFPSSSSPGQGLSLLWLLVHHDGGDISHLQGHSCVLSEMSTQSLECLANSRCLINVNLCFHSFVRITEPS